MVPKLSYEVAGAGIAPASQGYEPREVLLLYPADNTLKDPVDEVEKYSKKITIIE